MLGGVLSTFFLTIIIIIIFCCCRPLLVAQEVYFHEHLQKPLPTDPRHPPTVTKPDERPRHMTMHELIARDAAEQQAAAEKTRENRKDKKDDEGLYLILKMQPHEAAAPAPETKPKAPTDHDVVEQYLAYYPFKDEAHSMAYSLGTADPKEIKHVMNVLIRAENQKDDSKLPVTYPFDVIDKSLNWNQILEFSIRRADASARSGSKRAALRAAELRFVLCFSFFVFVLGEYFSFCLFASHILQDSACGTKEDSSANHRKIHGCRFWKAFC